METLQVLGWIYLGLSIGVITGVIVLGLFHLGNQRFRERNCDLEFKNRILRGENERLSKRGKPQPRKEEVEEKVSQKIDRFSN